MSEKENRGGRSVWRRALAIFCAFVVCAALAVAAYLYDDYRRFADGPLAGLESKIALDVPGGTSLAGIVELLRSRALQPGATLYWRVLARRMGVAGRLHAGEYALEPGMTPRALLRRMAAGEVIQHRFTIVDGWTFAQLRLALAQDEDVRHTLDGLGEDGIMQRLDEPGVAPEGQFLPETYSYVHGMSDLDILRRAHEALRRTLDGLWNERDAGMPLKSPYEALTLASIVEKETARAGERPQIAGVFLSRLKLGMKLQTDPSVIYGMGASYAGNLHKRDLETDTPFNTYTRTGLPPTPIALPGKAALMAVVHPAQTDALYFVARGDGTHEFSATLDEHNRAVAKFQLHKP